MRVAHVITMEPTAKQAKALLRACGAARFTWNWALAEWSRQYKAGDKPNAFKLKKQFNALKRQEFPWIYESPKDANQQPFIDLGKAFQAFFDSCSGKRRGPKVRYPRFKRKSGAPRFYVPNDKVKFTHRVVKLPVIGNVKLREPLRFNGKIAGCRVSHRAGRWFLSVSVDQDVRIPNIPTGGVCGIDLNTGNISTSDGEVISTPRVHRTADAQLKRANRKLHRRVLGSNNRAKAKSKLARVHGRAANIRKDFLDKITTRLARENQVCVIEDLNVKGMSKNHCIARSVMDGGFGMFRQMMAYKCEKFGSQLVVASRWFPSTKRCSRCGNLKDIRWGVDTYCCDKCGLVIPRDTNAAENLKQYPRLEGNWDAQVSRTTVESRPLLDSISYRASQLAEAVTNPCSHLSTFWEAGAQ